MREERDILRIRTMLNSDRYLCVARLDGIETYFIWESGNDGQDRVAVDHAGMLQVFPSEQSARATEGERLSQEETTLYDLDALERWCKSDLEAHDYSNLLNDWNIFADLPRGDSLFSKADRRADSLYDKLFRSCNLPAITAEHEQYTPMWSATETRALKRLLLLGLAEFRARRPP